MMSDLSSSDTVLLHLRGYWNVRGELPIAITQEGIAKATGLRRSHVPRILQRLKRSELVEERYGHVKAVKRKIKIYFLTELGFRKVEEILTELLKTRITVLREGGEAEMSLGEACTLLNMKPLEIINQLTPNKMLIMPEDVPEEFLDREKELEELKKAFLGRANVIALYGSKGIGKTFLVKRYLRELPNNWKVLWYNLEDLKTEDFLSHFSRHMGLDKELEPAQIAGMASSVLQKSSTLMVFDGYFEVEDEMVDFFSNLVKELESIDGVKALFLINEASPSYCRFYKHDSVESGWIEEIHLKGLDKDSAYQLLNVDDIEEHAFNRIYLMTNGNPLYIKLVRDEKIKELRNVSRFTLPEIKLLIHYKTMKRSDEAKGKKD